jgi:hypothetical protein
VVALDGRRTCVLVELVEIVEIVEIVSIVLTAVCWVSPLSA